MITGILLKVDIRKDDAFYTESFQKNNFDESIALKLIEEENKLSVPKRALPLFFTSFT